MDEDSLDQEEETANQNKICVLLLLSIVTCIAITIIVCSSYTGQK
jgi:flagellar basal body-associated protein FliL